MYPVGLHSFHIVQLVLIENQTHQRNLNFLELFARRTVAVRRHSKVLDPLVTEELQDSASIAYWPD